MQSKMQAFAKIIVPTSGSTYGAGTAATGGKMVPAEAGLGFFLARHYSGAGKYKQFERPDQPKVKDKGELQTTESYSQIRDSIENIGSTAKEKKPDGIWGPRTQNGIKNILNVSGTLLEFASKIEFTGNKDFTSGDQQALASQIPDEANPAAKIPASQLNERAEKICPILDKLNSFATALHQHLIGQYEEYKQTGYFSPGEVGTAEPKEVEIDSFDQNFLDRNERVFTVKYENLTLNFQLKDLKSFDTLKQKLKEQMSSAKMSDDQLNQWLLKNYNPLLREMKVKVLNTLETSGQLFLPKEYNELSALKKLIIATSQALKDTSKFPRSPQRQQFVTQLDEIIESIKDPEIYSSKKSLDSLKMNLNKLRSQMNQYSQASID